MYLDIDGRRAETGMIRYQKAMSLCVDQQLWAGMVEQAVDVMMTSEVSDDGTDRRHEQDHSVMVALDHAAHKMPWWPPWSRLVVVDTANVEMQGHPRHGHNN